MTAVSFASHTRQNFRIQDEYLHKMFLWAYCICTLFLRKYSQQTRVITKSYPFTVEVPKCWGKKTFYSNSFLLWTTCFWSSPPPDSSTLPKFRNLNVMRTNVLLHNFPLRMPPINVACNHSNPLHLSGNLHETKLKKKKNYQL